MVLLVTEPFVASATPGGISPSESVQTYVSLPPVAPSSSRIGTPTSAGFGAALGATTSGARTTMTSALVSVRWASMTALTVNVYVPAVVGVPEMTPSEAPSTTPGGSAPSLIDHVFGSERVAVIGSKNAVPTVAGGTPACSGPIVSFGTAGLILRINGSSEGTLAQPGFLSYLTVR
jgi:hypothetical protein